LVVAVVADGEGYIRDISSGDCNGLLIARTYADVQVACIIARAHPDSLLLT